MYIKAEVEQQLEALIATGERLSASFHREHGMVISYASSESETSLRAFYTSAIAAITRIAGEDSDYRRAVPELPTKGALSKPGSRPSFIPAVTGALIALRDSVQAGYLQSLEARLTANVHDDMLEQARALLHSRYHVAAMVIAGCVLENHLRKLVIRQSLTLNGHGSLSKYNNVLKDTVYPQTVWRRIQAIADLRNHAAHGNPNAVKSCEVKDSIEYITRVITDHA